MLAVVFQPGSDFQLATSAGTGGHRVRSGKHVLRHEARSEQHLLPSCFRRAPRVHRALGQVHPEVHFLSVALGNKELPVLHQLAKQAEGTLVCAHAVLKAAAAGVADEHQKRREGQDSGANNLESASDNTFVLQDILRAAERRSVRREYLPKAGRVQASRGLL